MRPKLTFFGLLLLCIAGLLTTHSALAFPPLPSSFYGTVKVNGQNVPDDTVVRALIDGQVYAESRTQTYQGNSVYNVDVKGNDTDTPEADGGDANSVVTFEVGGVKADQSGAWRSGTNIELNLTASASGALETPPPTLPPVPTQTPIGYIAPTATPALLAPLAAGVGSGSPWLIIGATVMAAALFLVWLVRQRRRT